MRISFLGQSPSSSEHAAHFSTDAQRVESALAPLKACAQEQRLIADRVEEQFAGKSRLDNGVDPQQVLDLMVSLRTLSNASYRNIVGMLNFVRDDDNGVTIDQALGRIIRHPLPSDEVRRVCTLLKSIRDAGAAFSARDHAPFGGDMHPVDPVLLWDATFVDQTLLLARMMYPLGVNMVNPELLSGVVGAIPANARIELRLPGNGGRNLVAIEPQERTSRIVFCGRGRVEFDPVELPEGSAVLIGRALKISEVYGSRLANAPLEAPVAALLSSEKVSRGALMVVRHQGEVYLFDRGSKEPIRFSFEPDRWTNYEPRSRMTDSGGYEYGQSGIFQVDRGD
jgi:hypothetical protein